jgi:glycosyltransferase involved in cell wall biosynthesis
MRSSKDVLKINIDGRMIYNSGIGRCLREIIKGITLIGRDARILLYCKLTDYERFIADYSIDSRKVLFREYNSDIYSIKEQLNGSLLSLKMNRKEVFFTPHYNLPYIIPANSVFVIHDFTQFKFPMYFGKGKVKFAKLVLNNAVRKARKIIVVSRLTFNDFCGYYPQYRDKAKVIYNGISKNFKVLSDREKEDFSRRKNLKDYILFIGNNKPHKNVSGLLNAFQDLKSKYPDQKLVIISSGLNLKDYGISDSIKKDIAIIENVLDSELIYYYNCARLLVLPSFYEGFGLPVLEAMACGCPVVASNLSSLPELCGDAAVLIDPYDKNSIAEGLEKIINDTNFKYNIIERGFRRARMFNWFYTAKEYIDIFKNTAKK